MKLKSILLDDKSMQRTLTRIAHEIIEKNKGVEDIILIGIKTRGVPLAKRIAEIIFNIEGIMVNVGSVDITLYRDDLTTFSDQPSVVYDSMDVDVKNKKIILVDDVLYTGRTGRAAIEAVIRKGRPQLIQLAVMVDRGHREVPIRADYIGKNIPTAKNEVISVQVSEVDGTDSVKIYEI